MPYEVTCGLEARGEASGEDRGYIRHGFNEQTNESWILHRTATLMRNRHCQMRDIAARRREEAANATGRNGTRGSHQGSHHQQPLSGYDLARSPKLPVSPAPKRPKRPRFAVKGGLGLGAPLWDRPGVVHFGSFNVHTGPPGRREQRA